MRSKSGQTNQNVEMGQAKMKTDSGQAKMKNKTGKQRKTGVLKKNFGKQNQKTWAKMGKKGPGFSIDTMGSHGRKGKADSWKGVQYKATNTFISHREVNRER